MKLPLLIAVILAASTAASEFKTPLTASWITRLAEHAETMLPEIRAAPEAGYMGMSFEEVISGVIMRFNAMYYSSVVLRGMSIAEKLDILLPGQGYNLKTDDEAAVDEAAEKEAGENVGEWDTVTDRVEMEELRKRNNLRDQSVIRVQTTVQEVVMRPESCIELQEAVQKFNKLFQDILYAAARRCGGKCHKDGPVLSEISKLADKYKTSRFAERVRSAERAAGCQNSAVDIGANLVTMTEVTKALEEGKVPLGKSD